MENGDRYEGEWKEGRKYGSGIYYFQNGDVYEGYFIDGQRNGKGIYIWVDKSCYNGDWEKDRMHGKGVYYPKEENGPFLAGYFENDEFVRAEEENPEESIKN